MGFRPCVRTVAGRRRADRRSEVSAEYSLSAAASCPDDPRVDGSVAVPGNVLADRFCNPPRASGLAGLGSWPRPPSRASLCAGSRLAPLGIGSLSSGHPYDGAADGAPGIDLRLACPEPELTDVSQ